jgi:hypothetical protein
MTTIARLQEGYAKNARLKLARYAEQVDSAFEKLSESSRTVPEKRP